MTIGRDHGRAAAGGSTDRARSLEIFAAVMREGSFSAAGRVLGLTPSAVARIVDRIEERLGVRLFLRSTRALTLTERHGAGSVRSALSKSVANPAPAGVVR